MTKRSNRSTTNDRGRSRKYSAGRRTGTILVYALGVALAVGVLGGFLLSGGVRQLDPVQRALYVTEQEAVLPFKIISRVTGYLFGGVVLKVTLYVLGSFGTYYVLRIALNWLDLRSRQVHARDGIFPVVELFKGALYDPNRDNAGAHPLITIAALDVQRTAAMQADKILVKTSDKALPAVVDAPALEVDSLPAMVLLSELARNPSLDALTLGVSERGTLTASLHDLMHVLAVGASGFGKSAFLRALIWQLAQVKEPVSVVGIDCFGSELNVIHNWSKLRYPVANEIPEAIATLQAVTGEIGRRKALYAALPTAYDLPSYNRLASEPLEPIVMFCDEGTAMLNEKSIADPLRRVVQTARQFGVYALLAGQNVNHRVMPTQTRDNFSTRLCFHTSKASRHVVLGETPDDVTIKGRAWVQRPGDTLTQIQCPYVTREEVQQVLTVGQPSQVIDLVASKPNGDARRVVALKADGLSDTAIAREVFNHGNTHYIEKVRGILRQQQQQTGSV